MNKKSSVPFSEECYIYILNIFIYNINYMNIYIYVNTCKYIQCVYLFIHIININTTHTYTGASQLIRMSWKSSFISVNQFKL